MRIITLDSLSNLLPKEVLRYRKRRIKKNRKKKAHNKYIIIKINKPHSAIKEKARIQREKFNKFTKSLDKV